jgi:D-alanyl-D-alanine carboxypeptidase/D-alanyl-D-alanine-endopeptidase (penicillin-binding protein 4)
MQHFGGVPFFSSAKAIAIALTVCAVAPCLTISRAGAQPRGQLSVVPHPQTTGAPPAVAPPNGAAGTANEEELAFQRLKPAIGIATQWLKRPELQHSLVGLEIMDIASGRVLFSANGNKRFVTASILKVLTTACAYETFGGSYTYKTALQGYGDIRGAKLNGPLVIMPSQDPSFTSDNLRNLLATVSPRVKVVAGPVLVATVPGGGDHFNTEWLVQDWGQDWMPVSSDLVIDRNIAPARDPGRGLPLAIVGSDNEPSALTRSLLQSPWAAAWVVFNKNTNSVTYFRPDVPVTGDFTVANPTDFNAAVARSLLRQMGVKVEGKQVSLGDGEQPIVFGEWQSKPLSEIIRFTLKESDNLYAQQLLRTLGTLPPLNRSLEKASLEDRGLARLTSWLSGIGVPAGETVIFDGCGLSRKNAVSPHALNLVLRHMSGASGSGPYIDLLIHEGEGSTRNFRFKTGAMDSVRSISGVLRTATGQPIALTAIINDHNPSVRELRGSLNALISQLQSLGTLRLKPVVSPPAHKATPAARSRSHGGRRRR